jgi:hypothetical protein
MRVLVVLLLVVIAVAVWLWLRERSARRTGERAAPANPDPFSNRGGTDEELRRLKVGDVVTFQARDFVIRGTITFDEGGYTWAEHLLDDTRTKRWLSVEDDEGLELALWQRVALADLEAGAAGDREVMSNGTTYRLQERGRARFSAVGATGTAAGGTAEYVDYAAADGQLLAFERYDDGDWEVGAGTPLHAGDLTVYPVSPP